MQFKESVPLYVSWTGSTNARNGRVATRRAKIFNSFHSFIYSVAGSEPMHTTK